MSLLVVAPAATIVLFLLGGGLAVTAFESLRATGAGGTFTLEHYRSVFAEPGFASSLLLTLWVSFLSTVLTVFLAVLTALGLRNIRRARRLVAYIYQLPLTLPHMVVAAAGLMLLGQSGLISRVFTGIGVITDPSQFPALVFDRAGIGIVLVYVWKQIPFVGLFVLAVLQSVGEDYEALARTLGARPRRVILNVLLPLILPGIVPASVIIFAFVFGAFEVPLLLGARYPSVLSVLAYRLYTDVDLTMRPQSMALSLVIAVIVLLLVVVYRWLTERGRAQ